MSVVCEVLSELHAFTATVLTPETCSKTHFRVASCRYFTVSAANLCRFGTKRRDVVYIMLCVCSFAVLSTDLFKWSQLCRFDVLCVYNSCEALTISVVYLLVKQKIRNDSANSSKPRHAWSIIEIYLNRVC